MNWQRIDTVPENEIVLFCTVDERFRNPFTYEIGKCRSRKYDQYWVFDQYHPGTWKSMHGTPTYWAKITPPKTLPKAPDFVGPGQEGPIRVPWK